MNYSEMSDSQINILVCKALGKGVSDYCRIMHMNDHTILLADNKTLFDPCNSWADAGQIIVSNLIALKPVSLFVGGHRWFATKGEGDFDIKAADNNPLRAAMIVFLMMQEGK